MPWFGNFQKDFPRSDEEEALPAGCEADDVEGHGEDEDEEDDNGSGSGSDVDEDEEEEVEDECDEENPDDVEYQE